jgi:DNA polymerase IV
MIACVENIGPARKPVMPVVRLPQAESAHRKVAGASLAAGWLSFFGKAAAQLPHIVHVHVDSFYAAVEQVRNPRLRGKAVVVLDRGAVASASLEAHRRGVASGMQIQEARKLCPNAIFVPGECWRYSDFVGRVRRILETYSERPEMTAFGSFYLDFSPLVGPGADFEARLRHLQSEILGQTGLHSSVGAGTSRFVAVLAALAHRPGGFRIVRPGCESEFLSPFAIKTLRGIPSTYLLAVAQSGIETIGQLQRIPKPVLTAAFGVAMGNRIWGSARGRVAPDDRPSVIPQSTGIGQSPFPA